MKALTICQPYAELIASGDKRVENRTWPTRHRGPLLIHAGKSREWLNLGPRGEIEQDPDDQMDRNSGLWLSDMVFGAVVAQVDVIDCLQSDDILRGAHDEQYPWIRAHSHVQGPWCWVLGNVRRIEPAVPWRGAQGLFDIDDERLEAFGVLAHG